MVKEKLDGLTSDGWIASNKTLKFWEYRNEKGKRKIGTNGGTLYRWSRPANRL